MQLKENTFLITGGGSGLGAACVRRFSVAGANVVLADINVEAGRALADELGERVKFIKTDVTSASDVEAAISAAVEIGDGVQGAINCAGILDASRVVGREGPYDLEAFTKVIQVNLIGTFNVVRLVATAMGVNKPNAEGERGVIINTSSVSAFEGQVGQAAYSASKGGVASMTLPIARELARFGVRVMAIAPGVFDTEMMQAAPEKVRQSLLDQSIFPPRFGAPDEFAALARHIVENPMLNGAVLRLDGAARMTAT